MKLHVKNGAFYLVMLTLFIITFFIFRSAYTDLVLHKQLAERDNAVYAQFQQLSQQVNNAAILTPSLLNTAGSSKAITLFFTDSTTVTAQLQLLKAVVTDSLTKQITLQLDTLIRSELSWLLVSNVPDSIVHHRASAHITSLENIHALIGQALARKNILISQHAQQLDAAIVKVRTWMIIFIAFALLLLFYSAFQLLKQRSSNEKKFRALVENSDDIIAMLDRNMYPFYRSPSAEMLTGFTKEEREGGVKMDEIHPDDKDQLVQCLAEIEKFPGKAIHATYRIKHRNGHYIWLEGTFTNMFADPNIKAIVVNMRDITERKNAEEALKTLNERFEYVTKATSDVIWDWDIASGTWYLGDGFNTLFGYPRNNGETSLHDWVAHIHPGDKERVLEQRNSRLKNPVAMNWQEEYRYLLADGSVAEISDRVILLKNQAGYWHMVGAMQNITATKRLETLLDKASSLAQLGSWDIDLQSSSIFWSVHTRQILETDDSFIPTFENVFSFYASEAQQTARQNIAQAIAYGKGWDTEVELTTFKGHQKWVRVIGEAEFSEGKCLRIFGSFQDIDLRKRAELQLQQTIKQNEDYKFALDESSIIAITDQRGVIQSVNDNFCKISKYSREELVGSTHRLINSGFHPPAFFIDLWHTISSGKTWRGEIKNKTKQGDDYWVYTTITPFLDKNNRPFQYLAIRFDITEKKLAEEAALKTLLEKNTILESIGDAFFAIDKNWIVTYWNRQAEKMLATQAAGILGKNLWEVFSGSVNSISYKMYHTALETGTVVHFEDYFQPLDKWFEISVFPASNGLSVYFKDITGRKNSELQLQQLNLNLQLQARELSISNAELEQFAYVASHDLQEPLRMVTSFLTQLEKKYANLLDDRGKKYIDFAVDGAKRMRQLILDLLDYSRAGRMDHCKEDCEFDGIVEEIKILYRKQIEEKNAIITCSPLPVIKCYKVPVRQVFQNIIGNALKYTAEDRACKITIDSIESPTHWQFNITDNGIGIEEEFFNRIFIIFQRLHNSDAYSGTGMGLAVTKKIIENLGGKIWLTSELHKGSTFSFTLLKDAI